MHRPAFRALGAENLYRLDAELNLPTGLHSHQAGKLAAAECARGSFADAAEALTRACGAAVAAPQAVRDMAIGAAADLDAFYDHVAPMPSGAATLLVLTVDGTGIVMREDGLREETRRKAERAAGTARLPDGERPHRKRMACVGAVYDAEPVPRKAVRKWLTASIADAAADVIARVFDEAEARDPGHLRTWVVLVDGANPQIGAIRAEAARRGVEIHIVIDLIHILQYPQRRPPHPARRRPGGHRGSRTRPGRAVRPRRAGRRRTCSRGPVHRAQCRGPQEDRRDRHLPAEQARIPVLRHRPREGLADRQRRDRRRM